MQILELEIKNLKNITVLEPMSFTRQVTLIYGNNGVGKTTILEAISLLGHVSSFRRICKGLDATEESPSLLFETHGKDLPQDSDAFRDIQTTLASSDSVSRWFREYDDNLPGAAIRFSVRTDLDGANDPLELFAYFRQTTTLSITQALSRQRDDMSMNDHFALIYSSSQKKGVDALVEHTLLNTPHTIRESGEDVIIERSSSQEGGFGLVSYINTDLNDFGRKNDIRESVKDLRNNFVTEMIKRLKVPFDGPNGSFRFLNSHPDARDQDRELALNPILEHIITDYREHFPSHSTNDSDSSPVFRITQCSYDEARVGDELVLRAKRRGETQPSSLDYMSAGENECFFIFMLLLGLPIRNSIILLDEPDLHLTTFAKRSFFDRLYRILDARGCQAIVATHSGFAYTFPEGIDRKLIKPEHRDRGVVYTSDFDPRFALQLSRSYWATAARALQAAGIREPVVAFLLVKKASLEDWYARHPALASAVINFACGLTVAGALALVSDALEAMGLQKGETHTKLTGVWVVGGLILATVLSLASAAKSLMDDSRK